MSIAPDTFTGKSGAGSCLAAYLPGGLSCSRDPAVAGEGNAAGLVWAGRSSSQRDNRCFTYRRTSVSCHPAPGVTIVGDHAAVRSSFSGSNPVRQA